MLVPLVLGVIWALAICSLSSPVAPPSHDQNYSQRRQEHESKQPQTSSDETFWERTASDPVAVFTAWLTAFTAVLAASTIGLWIVTWRSGVRQSRDMQASIALTKEAFTATERPYLLVSGVTSFTTGDTMPDDPVVGLRYTVGNYGKTPAIIENVCIEFSVGRFPEVPMRTDESNDLLLRSVLSAGEVRTGLREIVPDHIDISDAPDLRPRLTQGQEDLFFWVTLSYRGPFTSGHETSACWRYYRPESVFVRHGHGEKYNWVK